MGEGGDGVNTGDEQDGNGIPARQGMAPPGKGEAALRLRRGGELLGQGERWVRQYQQKKPSSASRVRTGKSMTI
ncbi:MAG: hypothetical protein ACLRIS_02600 [Flavonifractor plautii]